RGRSEEYDEVMEDRHQTFLRHLPVEDLDDDGDDHDDFLRRRADPWRTRAKWASWYHSRRGCCPTCLLSGACHADPPTFSADLCRLYIPRRRPGAGARAEPQLEAADGGDRLRRQRMVGPEGDARPRRREARRLLRRRSGPHSEGQTARSAGADLSG